MASVDIICMLSLFVISYLCIHIFCRSKKGHDLSKPVPGPFSLPIIGNLLEIFQAGYRTEELMLKWAKAYGRIFQFKMGPKTVYVLNDYELINEAWHHPEMQGRPTPDLTVKILGAGNGVVNASGETWKEHRRFVLNSFRKFGLGKSTFEDRISEEANRLTESIAKHNGKPMDVSYTFSLGSCNIISSLVFGRQLDHDHPTLVNEVSAVLDSFATAGPAGLNNTIPQLAYIKTGQMFIQANKKLEQSWSSSLQQHFESRNCNIETQDLVQGYLERLQEGLGADTTFSRQNLSWFVRDLFLAGTETVASTLRWATLLLMTHPEVQERCRQELDEVVGRERYPTTSDKCNLPYLNATLLEVFRVGNIAPLGVTHKTTGDAYVDGHHIPAGTMVISNVHAVMNDPSLWTQPGKFMPERFLNDDGKFIKPKEMIPFGIGKRVCLGEQLAKVELFIWLSRLLHQFRFELPEDGSPIPSINEARTGLARIPLPYRVRFIARED
ncbi:putative cytochrome P450 2J6 [Apostichopus japonicus]|uniref:Putative cytochrome P450 2J6 n=1 Tax=Stichopus japonicus TaxID=307972 RepID=A0A2G8JN28_STIJA|nr:putative cytochrome P450 2J6 [Apostichopus japonicus]